MTQRPAGEAARARGARRSWVSAMGAATACCIWEARSAPGALGLAAPAGPRLEGAAWGLQQPRVQQRQPPRVETAGGRARPPVSFKRGVGTSCAQAGVFGAQGGPTAARPRLRAAYGRAAPQGRLQLQPARWVMQRPLWRSSTWLRVRAGDWIVNPRHENMSERKHEGEGGGAAGTD